MTEVAKREFRDQATQISRPRIEGAESSRPSREPTPKNKELENKPVQDQTAKDFQEKDMRHHWSGYNDEDGDHLKLDIERIDEEGQDPNKETGQNDLPNQVSRISNNQVPGVDTQHQHDDGHSQAYGRYDQGAPG